jgi:streptogramin lyase
MRTNSMPSIAAALLTIPTSLQAQQIAVAEYAVPTAAAGPNEIAMGPDGALWFTEFSGNKVGRITTAGTITEYRVPTPASNPAEIAPGPDGALWFTEYSGNKIGRITTAGVIAEYPVPTPASLRMASPPGPTARCGLPNIMPARSDASPLPVW